MLFQLQQQLEDSRSGSRNWEGDDTYIDDVKDPGTLPDVSIIWKHSKSEFAVTERNLVLFGVRGAGSCYLHANLSDSTVLGAAVIPGVTSPKETASALAAATLSCVPPSASACLLCHSARLSCWVVCCQAPVPPEAARFLVEKVVGELSDGWVRSVEVHGLSSVVAALYRAPSRARVEPPAMWAVAAGVDLPVGVCGLEAPNMVEGVGAALINCAAFSEGVCKAVVYVTAVETGYVEPRCLKMFDEVVVKVFEGCVIELASESEVGKVLRKTTWSSPSHLFA